MTASFDLTVSGSPDLIHFPLVSFFRYPIPLLCFLQPLLIHGLRFKLIFGRHTGFSHSRYGCYLTINLVSNLWPHLINLLLLLLQLRLLLSSLRL